jgi:hypothetical protein
LSVVFAALSEPARHETVVLALDHAHRGLGCIVVTGRGPTSVLADLLVELALQEASVCAFVVASVRPGSGYLPCGHDEAAFHDVRAQLDALGVDLVDWFVISGRHATSLAETTDSQTRWRSP